ncbi:transport and Golgi organization protein 6 homolog isoform X2 [Daktulosphaira vitifoliae]|nr:transport and Golgi organization protein 6 homolog isoform X2 [Daktulosphaira vitifoliae]
MYCLKHYLLQDSVNNVEIVLSVAQNTKVSKCLDFIVALGFIPCFVPAVWVPFKYKQKINLRNIDNISLNKKYEELKFCMNSFLGLLNEPTFNRLILANHTAVIISGLCQLSLLPIAKPGSKIAIESSIDDLNYKNLLEDQKYYKLILRKIIIHDQNPLIIKEIIFLIGRKNCLKPIRIGLCEILSNLLIQTNGIQTLFGIVCDLISTETSHNMFQHGLHEWCHLIHNYYANSKSKYVTHIIPQIWQLLESNSKYHEKHFQSIAVYCMHLIAEENKKDFLTFYLNPMINELKNQEIKKKSLSQCIKNLHVSFFLFKDEMWALNPKTLIHIAGTIYKVYLSTVNGIYYQKLLLEDLVFLILVHFSNDRDVLKMILFTQYHVNVTYDDNKGDIIINHEIREHQLYLENEIEILLNLLERKNDANLTKTLFTTFLDMYTDSISNEYSIMEKLVIVKMVHHFIEKDNVQKTVSKDPKNVLNLIRSLLKSCANNETFDIQILSITLMILNSILENKNTNIICTLHDCIKYLEKISKFVEDELMKNMVFEIIQKVQNSYPDSSLKDKRSIDNILFDTQDRLLPCRAHALIELKKCIESGDLSVKTKKSTILVVLKENLKNTDSYLYLNAIFTLSSLCAYFPNEILPILCEEYSTPDNYNHSAETRLKIGEVLMKTVKTLNDTISLYKNRLLNTFMAGVRDNDFLVRASSLSNLADICCLLRYNLGSIISEIVNCADYVIKFDPANEPRRAAVLLLQLIIQGASLELLEILGDNIKDIYNILKFQYQCTNDETVKLHAQIAIERLNDIMKSLFLDGIKRKLK